MGSKCIQSALPDPLLYLGAGNGGNGKVERGGRGIESRGMEGRREERKGRGRQGAGVVVLGGIDTPDLTLQGSGSAAKVMT